MASGSQPGSPGHGLCHCASAPGGCPSWQECRPLKGFVPGLERGPGAPPLPYPPSPEPSSLGPVVLSNLGLVLAGNTAK